MCDPRKFGKDGRDGKDDDEKKDGIDGSRGKDGDEKKDGIDGSRGKDGDEKKDGFDGYNAKHGYKKRDGFDGSEGKDGIISGDNGNHISVYLPNDGKKNNRKEIDDDENSIRVFLPKKEPRDYDEKHDHDDDKIRVVLPVEKTRTVKDDGIDVIAPRTSRDDGIDVIAPRPSRDDGIDVIAPRTTRDDGVDVIAPRTSRDDGIDVITPRTSRDDGIDVIAPRTSRDDGIDVIAPRTSRDDGIDVITPRTSRDDGIDVIAPRTSRDDGINVIAPSVDRNQKRFRTIDIIVPRLKRPNNEDDDRYVRYIDIIHPTPFENDDDATHDKDMIYPTTPTPTGTVDSLPTPPSSPEPSDDEKGKMVDPLSIQRHPRPDRPSHGPEIGLAVNQSQLTKNPRNPSWLFLVVAISLLTVLFVGVIGRGGDEEGFAEEHEESTTGSSALPTRYDLASLKYMYGQTYTHKTSAAIALLAFTYIF